MVKTTSVLFATVSIALLCLCSCVARDRNHATTQSKAATSPSQIRLPSFGFYQEPGVVMVYGTWKAETNKLAFPVNTVDIECFAATGRCNEARAQLNGDYLDRIRRSYYVIKHWTATDLVAEGEEVQGTNCHSTLTINFPTQTVRVRQWCGESQMPMSPKPYEMTLRLVDGSEVTQSDRDGK